MLYLKNSLVNLTIIFFSLFFLSIAASDDNDFIFPKKKIITVKNVLKKQNNIEISKSFGAIYLPQTLLSIIHLLSLSFFPAFLPPAALPPFPPLPPFSASFTALAAYSSSSNSSLESF
jgi:hypothetical protein